jgi:hypothetical protein
MSMNRELNAAMQRASIASARHASAIIVIQK